SNWPLCLFTCGQGSLWEWNPDPDAYSPMGCGVFTPAMALSTYDPAGFGSYAAAHDLLAQMPQVPMIGGTFEGDNAAVARRAGFATTTFHNGTAADLMTAIDAGAGNIARGSNLPWPRPPRCAAGRLSPRRGGRAPGPVC